MPSTYHRNRLLLLAGFACSFLVFWFGGKWFAIPRDYGADGSLLRQPSAPFVVLIVAALVWIGVIVNTLIAGSVRAEAGIFCTSLGMIALSLRGVRMFYTLAGSSAGVFFLLALELVLLFAMLGASWLLVRKMVDVGLARRDPDFEPDDDSTLDQKLIAAATHAIAMFTVLLILCRTDQKAQTIASVGVSGLLASLLAGTIAPTRPSFWYWISPMLVGLLGYLWSSMSPQDLPIGQPRGYFQALARPLPLDYASTGTAGAMLGYWFARSWHRERERDEQAASDKDPDTDRGSESEMNNAAGVNQERAFHAT
jgi:hypothetical protein